MQDTVSYIEKNQVVCFTEFINERANKRRMKKLCYHHLLDKSSG